VVPSVNHITGKKQTLPTAAGQGTAVMEELSSSTSSSSSEEDFEQYEKEPGIRRPGSRSCSEDLDIDLEEYNEEPVPRKQEQGTGSDDHPLPKADSGLPAKKKGKKGPGLDVGGKKKSGGFADHVPNSPGISEDVWKEAMAGKPLASSESFDMHLLPSAKDKSDKLRDDNDDDAFERRPCRKGKQTRSNDQLSDLQWSADLPINDSLSRETLDDISCDSYIPPEPVSGWDVDSLEVIDDYLEEGAAKVLDILARSSDSSPGRVVGRRRERVDREDQQKQTLSTSFETNIDDIEFDTEPQGNVYNINKDTQAGNVPNTKPQEPPPPDVAKDTESNNWNVSNINKTKHAGTAEKEKPRRTKENRNTSNIDEAKEPTGDASGKGKKHRPKQQVVEDVVAPEEEKVGKKKTKKSKEPVSNIPARKSATIPIMGADAGAGSAPFEEDEDAYSGERLHDLSADINIRLWQGPTTNIDDSDDEVIDDDDDDDDLTNEDQDQLPSNLHDRRLDEEEEDSVAASDGEMPPSGKPPTSSSSQKVEVLDMLPDRPRRAQPIAGEEPWSSRQRKPLARTVARRPYNGICTFNLLSLSYCNNLKTYFVIAPLLQA